MDFTLLILDAPLTPQQQPGSNRGGDDDDDMSVSLVAETTDLRLVTDKLSHMYIACAWAPAV